MRDMKKQACTFQSHVTPWRLIAGIPPLGGTWLAGPGHTLHSCKGCTVAHAPSCPLFSLQPFGLTVKAGGGRVRADFRQLL